MKSYNSINNAKLPPSGEKQNHLLKKKTCLQVFNII